MPIIFGDQEVVIKRFVIDLAAYNGWGPEDHNELISLGGGSYVRFGNGILGYFQPVETIAFISSPSATETGVTSTPTGSDPPLPPVYPYPYSTGQVYARENLTANLRMTRGDTFVFRSQVFLNGVEVDITNCDFTMTCRYRPNEAIVFTRDSSGNGITITDATAGIFTVTVAPENTNTTPIDILRFPYDIQMVDGDGNIYTVMRGILRIDPDITRAEP